MKFLYPGFLIALVTLSIPIVIHLFNFRRFKKISFTNVRFLKEVKEETTSRNKLKHILVLIARLLALSFMIMAFAQPYIPQEQKKVNSAANAVSIYIDNSFSMEAQNGEGSLLDEAKLKAREIVTAYQLSDKFQLLTNDFEGRHQRFLSKDEFLNLLDEVKISPSNKTINEVITRQSAAFSNQFFANKRAFIISDFQKNFVDKQLNYSDSSCQIYLVPIRSAAVANVAIDSLFLISPIHKVGENEQLVIRFYNNSSKKVENIPIKFFVNKEQKAIGNISIPAQSYVTDTLNYRNTNAGWQAAEVQITDFPISFDDRYYFSYVVENQLPILIIDGGSPNPYLDAVYKSDPYFNVIHVSQNTIDYSQLSNYRLIILDELTLISSGIIDELKKYLASGGNVIFIPHFDGNLQSYNTLFQQLNANQFLQINVLETKVGSLNLQQGMFNGVFDKIPKNIDLPSVKQFFGTSNSSKTNKETILRLQSGGDLLTKYTYQSGYFYVLNTSLQTNYTDLPKHALFVPLMYRIALLGMRNQVLAYTIGRDYRLESQVLVLNQKSRFKLIKAETELIPDVRTTASGTALFVPDLVREDGHYVFQEGEKKLGLYAFNFNRKESVLHYLDPTELAKITSPFISLMDIGNRSLKNAIKESSYGIQLWKICVILALLFYAVEALLLRFWDRFNTKIIV